MPKNYGPMPGNNMQNLMKQAQKMQRQMQEMQAQLEEKDFEVTAGGGAIKIVINGKKELKSIEIQKDVVDPDDVEMLQDLVLSAVNEALRQAKEMSDKEIGAVTGGMGGLF